MSDLGGKFTSERVFRTIQSRINPIRGLTPSGLTTKIENWRAGYLAPLALLWEEMEDRDVLLKGVVGKRKRDAARCQYEIITEDDTTEAQAQKEFLEDFYSRLQVTSVLDQNQRGGVPLLLRQMMHAVGHRYSVHELAWVPSPDGSLSAVLHHAPVWFFEARTGRLRFLETDGALNGTEMPDGEWLVSVGDGLMLASCIAYLAKDLGLKDWLNYTERFGSPIVDASTNAPPDGEEWNALVDAVQTFVADGYLVRNQGAQIALLEAKGGGTLPHPPLIDYIDRSLASLWRGADLGTKSAGQGAGQGASLQGDETESLRADDCEWLSETLQMGLEIYALRWKFGQDVKPLAYIQISPPEKADVTQEVAVDEFLVRNGARLSVADALQRYGRPQAGEDEPVLTAPAVVPAGVPPGGGMGGMGGNGSEGSNGNAEADAEEPEDPEDPEDAAEDTGADRIDAAAMANASAEQVQAIREAFAADMQPVAARLRRILTIEDPQVLATKLESFRAELPQLMKSLGADPAAAREIEAMMARSMLQGMQQGANAGRA